jgi:hypothetical protein
MSFVSYEAESDTPDAAPHAPAPHGLNAPFDLRALDAAYRRCRRGKRPARNTQRYEARLLDRLVETAQCIGDGSWRPARTLAFVVSQPKWREIHAADFSDRVVHTLLVQRLELLYEPLFIHDSYANRAGRGSHAAVDRLQAFMRRQPGLHALQLDVANFFNSIHRPTLFHLLQGRLQRDFRAGKLTRDTAATLQTLCRAVLTADPLENVARRGSARLFERVPPHKRLGALGADTGLPIGNLTSQFFANVYLNELDQFVKHTLKARCYLRYVDDFVLLHDDPAQLRAWHDAITEFLRARLRLRLRPGTTLRPVGDGVDFLGYIVRPHYKLVRRRVVNHCRAALARFEKRHVHPNGWRLPPAARDALRATLASYIGHFRHAAHTRLLVALRRRFPWLDELFDWQGAAIVARPAWAPRAADSLAAEWRYFRARFPGALVLMRVGNEYLAGGSDARLLATLGMARIAAKSRPGFSANAGVPRRALSGLRRRLKQAGIAHVVAIEEGLRGNGRRRRSIALIWFPSPFTPVSSPRSTS